MSFGVAFSFASPTFGNINRANERERTTTVSFGCNVILLMSNYVEYVFKFRALIDGIHGFCKYSLKIKLLNTSILQNRYDVKCQKQHHSAVAAAVAIETNEDQRLCRTY